ncbi:prenyltransferase/squalene oxidase repeat-containing protein [Methanopyrus sp. KOL6]|uniref:prenyltransferase/squalene oxidase repeat-containing protein n=1 Tax=Methanopyrus sp. KOL6 TaxID=1937004 RepID=UPI000B4AB903|nr:prenyltransferase/squalene oxidase repeat-containing protein [Methanopyrus sp. KOL6]
MTALIVALMVPTSAYAVSWGEIIDKSVRFYFAIDKARELDVPVKELKMVQEGDSLYWKGKFGRSKWETSGEVIYGNMSALSGIYLGLLSGEVTPKTWPEPERSRFEKGITTGLAKILSLQQEDGGWGWKVVLTEGKTRFPSGKGHVLRTSQVLVRVLIPALRLNIKNVNYDGTTYDVVEHARSAVRFLIDQQLEDGGYSANKEWSTTGDPLYTGWALRALCEAYRYRDLLKLDDATVQQVKEAIRRAVDWLLSHQEREGEHVGLWKMESSAIMGSSYAPPSEAQVVLALIDAYSISEELGLNRAELKESIDRALEAIVDWALKYKDISVVEFDGKKVLGWAYSSTRLESCGPYLGYTALIAATLKLARELGLGSRAVDKMKSVGVTLENEAEWVAHEWRETDGIGYFPYPNSEVFKYVTPSSQLFGLIGAVAFSHPEVLLKRTTADVWKLVPKTKTSKVPVWPVLALLFARRRR